MTGNIMKDSHYIEVDQLEITFDAYYGSNQYDDPHEVEITAVQAGGQIVKDEQSYELWVLIQGDPDDFYTWNQLVEKCYESMDFSNLNVTPHQHANGLC